MPGTINFLYSRGYFSDFYFMTADMAQIQNQPYLSENGENFSMTFDNSLSPRSLSYSAASQNSVITTIKEICLVDKNKLLVYGSSAAAAPANQVFEIHELYNNSPNQVKKVTHLMTQSKEYNLRSCDYTGGAWLRSVNPEEEHAFFDPEAN